MPCVEMVNSISTTSSRSGTPTNVIDSKSSSPSEKQNIHKITKSKGTKKKRIRTVAGSCNQCFRCRVKCTLEKPSCRRCREKGLDCSYDKVSLKWGKMLNVNTAANGASGKSGVGQKNNMFMFSGRNAKPLFTLIQSINDNKKKVVSVSDNNNLKRETSSPNPMAQMLIQRMRYGQQNTTGSSSSNSSNSTVQSSNCAGSSRYVFPASPPPEGGNNACYANTLPIHISDMQYFGNVLLAKLHAFGTPLDVRGYEFIQRSKILQNLAATLVACHFHNERPDFLTSDEIHRMKARSIQLLVEQINKQSVQKDQQSPQSLFPNKLPGNTDMESLLDACILMSILDSVIDCTNLNIVPTHLFGARSIFKELLEKEPNFVTNLKARNPLTQRTFSIFATMDLMYCLLTCECLTCITEVDWIRLHGCDCWFGELTAEDPFLKVLSGLAFFSNSACLIKARNLPTNISKELSDTCKMLMELSGHSSLSRWRLFVSCFADVGLLYYVRVFQKKSIDDKIVQSLVYSFISKLKVGPQTSVTSPNDNDSTHSKYVLDHCLLFPLMIIGAHCIHPEHQLFIRQWASKAVQSLAFKNIYNLLAFLDKVWTSFQSCEDNRSRAGSMNISWKDQFSWISKKSIIL